MYTVEALTIPSAQWLARLGESIDSRGLETNLPQVRALVRTARGLGVAPVLCQVALDPSAPEPVRSRAAGYLIRRVASATAGRPSLELEGAPV